LAPCPHDTKPSRQQPRFATTANLACLRARLRFEEGHSAEAIDDIISAMTLGRRVSLNGINSMVLTSYAIEHRMSEVLALDLPRLDVRMIKALKKRLDALPPGGSPATALKVEEQFALDWLVGKNSVHFCVVGSSRVADRARHLTYRRAGRDSRQVFAHGRIVHQRLN
jgi:hypothetical protein